MSTAEDFYNSQEGRNCETLEHYIAKLRKEILGKLTAAKENLAMGKSIVRQAEADIAAYDRILSETYTLTPYRSTSDEASK